MQVTYAAQNTCGELRFSGELDHHAAAPTIRQAEALLDRYQPGALVVDLAGVTFMDSSGIAVLLKLSRRMQMAGGSFSAQNTPAQAYRMLTGAGVHKWIKLSKKRDDA